MLNENIKTARKSKGLSQEEFAIKLNIVRQTVSKWENGLSVPDSEMLIHISEVLETPVSVLLGEAIVENEINHIKLISEKLEVINYQLAQRKDERRKALRWIFIALSILILIIFVIMLNFKSDYLNWDYSDPEAAVVGVAIHAFEWLFVRIAPFVLLGGVVGIILTRRKK